MMILLVILYGIILHGYKPFVSAVLGPGIAPCYEACSIKYNDLQSKANETSCQHGCTLSSSFEFLGDIREYERSCMIWCSNRIITPASRKTILEACMNGCTFPQTSKLHLTVVFEGNAASDIDIDDVLTDPGLRNQFRITDTKIPSTYYTNLPASFFEDHPMKQARVCRDLWSRWSSVIYFVFVVTFFAGVVYGFKMTPTSMFYSTEGYVSPQGQDIFFPKEKPPAYTEKPTPGECAV